MKTKPVKKGEGADRNEDGEGNEGQMPENGEGKENEDEEEGEDANKSDLTEADLVKSLKALEAIAKADSPKSRKDALLAKAAKDDLTKAEVDELYGLMGGTQTETDQDSLAKSVTQGLQDNDTIQKAVDVSEYLGAHQEELVKALSVVADTVDAQDRRQHAFNLVLAKAVCDSGALIKAMSERLGVIEGQPVRAPRSVGVPGSSTQILNKGFSGADPAGETLSKGEALSAMMGMLEKSMVEGRNGVSPSGEDITLAVAKFEQIGDMSKAMRKDINEFRKSRHAA